MATRPEPDLLHDLASRVARLIPSRRDPERFFAEKSEIAHDLRQLADNLTGTPERKTR